VLVLVLVLALVLVLLLIECRATGCGWLAGTEVAVSLRKAMWRQPAATRLLEARDHCREQVNIVPNIYEQKQQIAFFLLRTFDPTYLVSQITDDSAHIAAQGILQTKRRLPALFRAFAIPGWSGKNPDQTRGGSGNPRPNYGLLAQQ
jgi:hypothetical protein